MHNFITSPLTYCQLKRDAPGGLLAIVSLLPRFISELLREHMPGNSQEEIKHIAQQSFSSIAHIIGWTQYQSHSRGSTLFYDPLQRATIATYIRGATHFWNNKASIQERFNEIHKEATDTNEFYRHNNPKGDTPDYLLLCTVLPIINTKRKLLRHNDYERFCSDMAAGARSTSMKYGDRAISFIPYHRQQIDHDGWERLMGCCVIFEKVVLTVT